MADKEISNGLEFLRTLPEGTILYTILRKVSKSRMVRVIDVRVIQPTAISLTGGPGEVDVLAVRVPEIGKSYAKNYETAQKWGGDYRVNGCGTDMGFEIVSALSRIAFPDAKRPDYYFKHKWL